MNLTPMIAVPTMLLIIVMAIAVSGGGRRGHIGGVVRARRLLAGRGEWLRLTSQALPPGRSFRYEFFKA
jgi:hypothetical protein